MPVLITVGESGALQPILNEIVAELNPADLYAVVRPEVMTLLLKHYRVVEEWEMQRMGSRS